MDDDSTSTSPPTRRGDATGEASDGCGAWLTLGCLGGPGVLLAIVGGMLLTTAFMSSEASINLWVGSGLLLAIGATLTWGAIETYRSPSRQASRSAVEDATAESADSRETSAPTADATASESTSGRASAPNGQAPPSDDPSDNPSSGASSTLPTSERVSLERCPTCETVLDTYRPRDVESLDYCPRCGHSLAEAPSAEMRRRELRRAIAKRQYAIESWFDWASEREIADDERDAFLEPHFDAIADLRREWSAIDGAAPPVETTKPERRDEESPSPQLELPWAKDEPKLDTDSVSPRKNHQAEPPESPEPSRHAEASDSHRPLSTSNAPPPPEAEAAETSPSSRDELPASPSRTEASQEGLDDASVPSRVSDDPEDEPPSSREKNLSMSSPSNETSSSRDALTDPDALRSTEEGDSEHDGEATIDEDSPLEAAADDGGAPTTRMPDSTDGGDEADSPSLSSEAEPISDEELDPSVDAPDTEGASLWADALRPFLIGHWYYVLGAFLVLSGGIYLLSTVWASISSLGRHLVTFGLLASASGGFASFGRYLSRAFPEQSAGRAFWLIGFGLVGITASASGAIIRDTPLWGGAAVVGATALGWGVQVPLSTDDVDVPLLWRLAPMGLLVVVGGISGLPSTQWASHLVALHVGFALVWLHCYQVMARSEGERAWPRRLTLWFHHLVPTGVFALLALLVAAVHFDQSNVWSEVVPWLGSLAALAGMSLAELHAGGARDRGWAAVSGLTLGALGIGAGLEPPVAHLGAALFATIAAHRVRTLGSRAEAALHIGGAFVWAGMLRTLDGLLPVALLGPDLVAARHGLWAAPYVGWLVYRLNITREEQPAAADALRPLAMIGIVLGGLVPLLAIGSSTGIWAAAAPTYSLLAHGLAVVTAWPLVAYLGSAFAVAWVGLTPLFVSMSWLAVLDGLPSTPIAISLVALVALAATLLTASMWAEPRNDMLASVWGDTSLAVAPLVALCLANGSVWNQLPDWSPEPLWMAAYVSVTLYGGVLLVETRRTGYRWLSHLTPLVLIGSTALWGYGLKQLVSPSSSDRGVMVGAIGVLGLFELAYRLADTGRNVESRRGRFGQPPSESAEPLWRAPLRRYGLSAACLIVGAVALPTLRLPPRLMAGGVMIIVAIRALQGLEHSRIGPGLLAGTLLALGASWMSLPYGDWLSEAEALLLATTGVALAQESLLALIPDGPDDDETRSKWSIDGETWGHLERLSSYVFVGTSALAAVIGVMIAWEGLGPRTRVWIAVFSLLPLAVDQIRRPAKYSAWMAALASSAILVAPPQTGAFTVPIIVGCAVGWMAIEWGLASSSTDSMSERRHLYWRIAGGTASAIAVVSLPIWLLIDTRVWLQTTYNPPPPLVEGVLAGIPLLYGLLYLRLRSGYHWLAIVAAGIGWSGFVVGWTRETLDLQLLAVPTLWALLTLGADGVAGWLRDRHDARRDDDSEDESTRDDADEDSPQKNDSSLWGSLWPESPGWALDDLARHHRGLWMGWARWGLAASVVSALACYVFAGTSHVPSSETWPMGHTPWWSAHTLGLMAAAVGAMGVRRVYDRRSDRVGPIVLVIAVFGVAICWIEVNSAHDWTYALAAAALGYEGLLLFTDSIGSSRQPREEASESLETSPPLASLARTARVAFLVVASAAAVVSLGRLALSSDISGLGVAAALVPLALDQIRRPNAASAVVVASFLSIAAFPAAARTIGGVEGWWLSVTLGIATGWLVLLGLLDGLARWFGGREREETLDFYRPLISTIVAVMLLGTLPLWTAAHVSAWAVEVTSWRLSLAEQAGQCSAFAIVLPLYVAGYLRLHRLRHLGALLAVGLTWPLWGGAWSLSWGEPWLSAPSIWAMGAIGSGLVLLWRLGPDVDKSGPTREATTEVVSEGWSLQTPLRRHADLWRAVQIVAILLVLITALTESIVAGGIAVSLAALALLIAGPSPYDGADMFVMTAALMLMVTSLLSAPLSSGALGAQVLLLAGSATLAACGWKIAGWWTSVSLDNSGAAREPPRVSTIYRRVGFVWMVLLVPLLGFGVQPEWALASSTLTHGLAIGALGGTTVLWSWEPVESGREWPAYLGAAGLFGLYAYIRVRMGVGTVEHDSWMMLVLGSGFLAFETALERAGRDIWRRVTLRVGLALPWMALLFGFWHPEVFPNGLLATSSVFYVLLGWHFNRRGLYIPAGIFCNLEVLRAWLEFGWMSPLLWALPVGLTLLIFARLYREALSPTGRNGLRIAGCAAIYLSNAWELVALYELIDVLALAGLSIAGIVGGILLRIRSYLYLGTTFLVGDVLFNMFRLGVQDRKWAAFFLVLAGLIVLGGGLYYNLRRETVRARLETVREELDDWE